MSLSNNTIERICRIYGYLEYLEKNNIEYASSKEFAGIVGTTDYSVRKDISSLGLTGFSRRGYAVKLLKDQLGEKLKLSRTIKTCIVGLGKLGTAILDYESFRDDGFNMVAGFDSSINKIERIHTPIEVFPVGQLEDIVKQRSIELGIIAVPPVAAQDIADKLIKGGVKGILNFSPVRIAVPEEIVLHNMDFTAALRFVAARF
ncbi:MAG: hypothetical protein A2Y40_00185 [Candidatus Margulisbacteria bacterium GWF2_35_9]|nr:MAG: hypothetical protein A2Y40_00185 [Candidatus Margulisbacteria bacterium GWF2_35_9]